MKIVIDISEELYEIIKELVKKQNSVFPEADSAEKIILNGTPLPKGHGRLIILSEDAVKREQTPLNFSCQNWISEVGLSNATVTIIEADKAESEKGEQTE